MSEEPLDTESEETGCTGGGMSARDPSFNPEHDFEGTDRCRQCGASKYLERDGE